MTLSGNTTITITIIIPWSNINLMVMDRGILIIIMVFEHDSVLVVMETKL